MSDIDWSEYATTFDAVRRQHNRDFAALPVAEKIQALEDMEDVAIALRASRQQAGAPATSPSDG